MPFIARNYKIRNSGRYYRAGSFIPEKPLNHQTYEVQAVPATAALPAVPPSTPAVQLQPQPQPQPQPQQQLQPQPQPQPQQQLQQQPQPQLQPQEAETSLKQADTVMTGEEMETEQLSSSSPRQPLFKTKLFGIKKISNKERRRRQNALLRRLTSPKNALMCINEMLPNEQIANQFKVRAASQDGFFFNTGSHNFCAELAIDGVTYKAYGENKLSARNAAAEQAIRDIVLKKMERYSEVMALQAANETEGGAGGAGGAAATPDALLEAEGADALPMIQLLSYALHKLFAEWEGAGHVVPQMRPRPQLQNEDEEMWNQENARGVRVPSPVVAKPRKIKKVPENASSMHPAMLLTILRPHATYRELNTEGERPHSMIFTMAVDTEEQTFIGRASNKKEARKAAARAACKGILGITFDDECIGISTLSSN